MKEQARSTGSVARVRLEINSDTLRVIDGMANLLGTSRGDVITAAVTSFAKITSNIDESAKAIRETAGGLIEIREQMSVIVDFIVDAVRSESQR